MDTMKRHGVKEIVLFGDDREDLYPVYRDEKYYDSENRYHTKYYEWENQRYYIYTYEVTSEDGEIAIWYGEKASIKVVNTYLPCLKHPRIASCSLRGIP